MENLKTLTAPIFYYATAIYLGHARKFEENKNNDEMKKN